MLILILALLAAPSPRDVPAVAETVPRRPSGTKTGTPVAASIGEDDAGTRHFVVSGAASQETIDELRRSLDRPTPTTRAALEEDLRSLVPLIVPRQYFTVGVPAPEHRLPESTLSVTWVLLQPTTMLYLSVDETSRFDKEGFPWQARAMENLARAPGGLATHEKRSPDGRLIWMAAMHADGLGSSRLLLDPAWKRVFPGGYWVALPDRSCGLAISKSAKPSEIEEARALVKTMYEGATTPMSGRLYEPAELAVPGDWFGKLRTP